MQEKKKLIKKIIDTFEIARDKFPGSGISLDALCKRFRIDNSRRKKHTALIDCELLSKVYINLIDQKEPNLNFISKMKKNNLNKNNKNLIIKKLLNLHQKKLELHKKFLKKNLKKKLF